MQQFLVRQDLGYMQHCKENAPIYTYALIRIAPMMSPVIADCPDLAPRPVESQDGAREDDD